MDPAAACYGAGPRQTGRVGAYGCAMRNVALATRQFMTDRLPNLDLLLTAATEMRARAYAPYSRFPVGAALLDESGQVHAGCNVENAAYPVGTCAEAGAIAAMVAGGGRRIVEILIVGGGAALVTPCGACRQRIREFAEPSALIHIAGSDGMRRSFTLHELLPASFGPDNLA